MKIIIAGAGKIGYSVADILSHEGHDVTVIDMDTELITRVSNELDVICVEGNVTSPETLLEAGAAGADLLMAATRSDETNMVCGITASKLGTSHVIARIRDPEYLSQTDFLREALGLSFIVNPELECAKEISRILRFPSAVRVDSFSKGSAEIIEHKVTAGSKLEGVQLKALIRVFGAKVLISVVERDGKAIIPNGELVLKAEDRLSITGSAKEVRKFFIAAGEYKKSVKNVIIIGGGKIAVYLAPMLIDSGMSVTVVEKDQKQCEELCGLIPGVHVVCGDATMNDVLLEEGIRDTDAFVALTGDDGDNMIASMYAKLCKVGKIVTKVNREHYAEILENSGLDSIVAPRKLVSQLLARYVRAMDNSMGSSMETLYRLVDGQVEALEFKVDESSACIGIPLKDLHLCPNTLICALIRGQQSIIPDGNTTIRPGDHAIIVCPAGQVKNIDDIVEVDK